MPEALEGIERGSVLLGAAGGGLDKLRPRLHRLQIRVSFYNNLVHPERLGAWADRRRTRGPEWLLPPSQNTCIAPRAC